MAPFKAALVAMAASAFADKAVPLDSKEAAAALNALFTSSAPTDGVFLRQTAKWETFCGGACYKGRPDCTTSAEFFNLQIGVNQSSFFTAEFYFAPQAGVVLNTALMKQLARCFGILDLHSVYRYNGGCGCIAEEQYRNCESPYSPYRNVAPDGEFVYGDSPEAMKCHCTENSSESSGCFWRGPAYNTSKGLYGASEMKQFVEMREKDLPHIGTWDEVVLDSRMLGEVVAKDPATAFVAVFFFWTSGREGEFNPENIAKAVALQRALKTSHGVDLPIVGINQSIKVSAERGPFFEHKLGAEDLAGSGTGAEAVVV